LTDSEVELVITEGFIKMPALIAMVSSSIEVFHQETIGYLLGHRTEAGFVTEYAIPFQTVERGYAHATINDERIGRIVQMLEPLNIDMKLIGAFHSHTQFGDHRADSLPSDTDLYNMVPGYLHLIVAVNHKKRGQYWKENQDDTISGTIDQYHIKIGGYVITEAGWKKYRRVKLRMPSLTVEKND
jgi:proteasome lid subunit RPN8/RPN11